MLEHHTIVIPQLQKKKAAVLAHHIIVMAMLLLLGVPLRCAWVGLEFGSCSKTRRPNGITDAALRVQIPNAKTRLLTVERQFTASLARRCIRAHELLTPHGRLLWAGAEMHPCSCGIYEVCVGSEER